MSRIRTLQELFQRYLHPGGRLFAGAFVVFALFLVIVLPDQTAWVKRTKFYAQPAFWPAVSVGLMLVFGLFHLITTLVSKKAMGSWREVWYWVRSVEYALWFMVYVVTVPILGYLLSTLIFSGVLAWRLGYRTWRWQLVSALFGLVVVLLFKAFLQVKIPAGELYELLPPSDFRLFLMTYF